MRSGTKSLLLAYASAGEHREIVFAVSRSQAQEMLSAIMCDGHNEVIVCTRAPWADEYAEMGHIPLDVRVEQGLRVECAHCSASLTVASMVISEGTPFCNHGCSSAFIVGQSADLVALQEAMDIALALWPEACVKRAEMIEARPRVHFTFGSPARHAFWFIDEDNVDVAPVDRVAWGDFNDRMRLARDI